jgi:hypothetical protein
MPKSETDPLTESIQDLDDLLCRLARRIAECAADAEAETERPVVNRLLMAANHVRQARFALTLQFLRLDLLRERPQTSAPDTSTDPRVEMPPPSGFAAPVSSAHPLAWGGPFVTYPTGR